MASVDNFLAKFNQLDGELRRIVGVTGAEPRPSFGHVLKQASRSQQALDRDTKEWLERAADLRNVLAHDRGWPDHLACPTEDALRRLDAILVAIQEGPQTVFDLASRNPEVFDDAAPLAEALRYMGEHDFSQVIVRQDGQLRLLTSEGVARWLELNLDDSGSILVTEATVEDAVAEDLPHSHLNWPRRRRALEAHKAFSRPREANTPLLYAIIVTENGDSREKPLGIVTSWDLLRSSG